MQIIIGIIFLIGLGAFLADLYKGLSLCSPNTPLPSRSEIRLLYIAWGLAGSLVCILIVLMAFFGEMHFGFSQK